jgi:hypothetical protein
MVVASCITTLIGETLKAVEVELTLKAGELALVEVVGHDVIDKLLGVVYNKSTAVWLPRNDMSEAVGFNLVEESMKLDGKGELDASATLTDGLGWLRVDFS